MIFFHKNYTYLFIKKDFKLQKNKLHNFLLIRRDIIDKNGVIISRNINTFHAAIDPKLVKDKKNLLIKLRLNFPELPIKEIEKKLTEKNIFELKKE